MILPPVVAFEFAGPDMSMQPSARVLKKPLRLDDEVRFLRSWIEKPLHMGAVMPSEQIAGADHGGLCGC